MKRKLTYWGVGVSGAVLLLTLGAAYQGQQTIGCAENQSTRTCPHVMELGPQCQVEIVRMSFTDHVESLLYLHQIPDAAREEYRFAVVTLKITKPVGQSLSLAAADLTLHYYHGDKTEVAPCEGLSWFKSDSEAEMPILMNPVPGPGFIKQTTSPEHTAGTMVYIDAVFGFMEPDTRECWICLGHPAATEPFTCPAPAWRNESHESMTPKVPPGLQAPPA
ncbi:MAG: hypothetical protein M1376_02855 [Planctomycetes bacterium]|nr:hypothetical protein [Planctomycetota bacterium]